jgi:hypothetical protein
MSSDVIIGLDGKPRCGWAGAADTALSRYHDQVWGTRTYDQTAMFEALSLGVFEVGLSWSIVFGKRDAFREAFRGFDVAKVAVMTQRDVDRLVQDAWAAGWLRGYRVTPVSAAQYLSSWSWTSGSRAAGCAVRGLRW